MKKVTGLLGRYYPFFLSNTDLSFSHLLYQVYSPGVDKNMIPQVSLTKVSEKTRPATESGDGLGDDLDLIKVCMGRDKVTEREAAEYIDSVLKRVWGKSKCSVGHKFPEVEYTEDGYFLKNLVSVLRDNLRWKCYRYFPGRYIDVLWTKDEFTVFQICEDKDSYYLKPLDVLYKNTDTALSNPMKFNLSDSFTSEHWEKNKPGRASEMNRYLKNLEWDSFTRKPIF